MDSTSFGVFLIAALVLLLTPGPAVLYIVARSIEQGSRAGLVSSLGMFLGGVVHVAAAALGVSAILLSSALAFAAIKYIGAVYLIYLGVRTLLSAGSVTELALPTHQPPAAILRQAVVVQLLNPKAALFFFAFLPQFIAPSKGEPLGQILFLGSVFLMLALTTDCAYALVAGRLSGWVRRSARVLRLQRRLAGATYIGLGLLTAASGTGNK